MTTITPRHANASEQSLIRSGAEQIELAERLYLGLFSVAVMVAIAGGAISALLAILRPRDLHSGLTPDLSLMWAAAGASSLARPQAAYLWLRCHPWRQALPGLLGAALLLIDGPYGPLWFAALGGIMITATVAPASTTITVAGTGAIAYIAGTAGRGANLMPSDSIAYLAASVGLVLNGLVAVALVECFARFTLRLRAYESASRAEDRPLRVASRNLTPVGQLPAPQPPPRHRHRPTGPLTARQLEVLALLCDGLRQHEIAQCLGISARQVERHLADARQRTGAHTTAQLVATFVANCS